VAAAFGCNACIVPQEGCRNWLGLAAVLEHTRCLGVRRAGHGAAWYTLLSTWSLAGAARGPAGGGGFRFDDAHRGLRTLQAGASI